MRRRPSQVSDVHKNKEMLTRANDLLNSLHQLLGLIESNRCRSREFSSLRDEVLRESCRVGRDMDYHPQAVDATPLKEMTHALNERPKRALRSMRQSRMKLFEWTAYLESLHPDPRPLDQLVSLYSGTPVAKFISVVMHAFSVWEFATFLLVSTGAIYMMIAAWLFG